MPLTAIDRAVLSDIQVIRATGNITGDRLTRFLDVLEHKIYLNAQLEEKVLELKMEIANSGVDKKGTLEK